MVRIILFCLFILTNACKTCTNYDYKKIENSKECVEAFYDYIFLEDSLKLAEIYETSVKDINILTQMCTRDEIRSIIKNAIVVDDGYWMDSLVVLSFNNGNKLYFEVNTDHPYMINYIWLPDGTEFGCNDCKFLRPFIINDSNEYTYLYKDKYGEKPSTKIIHNNEIFFYMPISNNSWFPVYKTEDTNKPCIGYIHKSKIIQFERFPKYLKERVRHIRTEC